MHKWFFHSLSVKASDDDDNDYDVSNSGEVGSCDTGTAMEAEQSLADEPPRNHGKLILDATVAEQAIRYPTDLGLLNEARELSERIIDELHARSNWPQKKKPRTYREIARKAYLSLVKLRRPSNRKRRAGIRQQLQFLHRNLNHIEAMLTEYTPGTPHTITQLVVAPLLGITPSVPATICNVQNQHQTL